MKTVLNKLIVFILPFLIYACQNDYKLIENSVKEDIISSFQVKGVFIKTDSLSYSNEYYTYYDSYELNKKVYLLSYNSKTNSLDIVNISDRQIEEHIILADDGPNSIIGIMGLNVISPDSILISDNSKFCIIDHEGTIIWKLMKNNTAILKNLPPGYLNSRDCFKPGFNTKENSIVLYFNPFDSKKCFKLPMLVQININTLETKLLPFYLPPSLKSDLSYNPIYHGPRACFEKDRIVINFASESNIYTYDYSDKKVSAYGGKSKYTPNRLQPMEKGKNPTDYVLTSNCFFKLVYDPYKNLYYRAHWGNMKLKKTEFEYNTYYDKPVYLTVFDESFSYLFETKLEIESGIDPEQLIPTPEGLLVFPLKQKIENFEKDLLAVYLINFSN